MKSSPRFADELLKTGPSKQNLIALSLQADIRAGTHPVGSLMPTEEALCTKFGVSRHTVRSALRILQDKGYLRAERPVGTRVIADKADEKQTIRLTSLSDLVELSVGGKQVVTRNEDIAADAEMAKEIGCPVGHHWQHLIVKRWTGGSVAAPTMISQIWIHPMYAGVAKGMPLNKKTPIVVFIEAIGERYGASPSEVKQAISAVSVTGEMADFLQVADGSAGLQTQRWFRSRTGDLMLYVRVTYNGLLYTYQTTLHLDN